MACEKVVGVDASDAGIKMIDYLKQRHDNLELMCANATSDVDLGAQFDIVVSCDTLEHVSDPGKFFAFVARHLKPGGTAHILFPNELPECRHGVTGFGCVREIWEVAGGNRGDLSADYADGDGWERRKSLEKGEREGTVEVFRVDLSLWCRFVVAVSYGWRRLFRRGGDGRRPQCFDETNFFRHVGVWTKLAPLINLYWLVVLRLCKMGGNVYRVRPVRVGDFDENCNLYVRVKKGDR